MKMQWVYLEKNFLSAKILSSFNRSDWGGALAQSSATFESVMNYWNVPRSVVVTPLAVKQFMDRLENAWAKLFPPMAEHILLEYPLPHRTLLSSTSIHQHCWIRLFSVSPLCCFFRCFMSHREAL